MTANAHEDLGDDAQAGDAIRPGEIDAERYIQSLGRLWADRAPIDPAPDHQHKDESA